MGKFDIEIGRHGIPYIPRRQLLYLKCECGEIDDDIDCLVRCNFHAKARYSLFPSIASYLPLQEPIKKLLMRSNFTQWSWRIRIIPSGKCFGNSFTKNCKGANRNRVMLTHTFFLQDVLIIFMEITLYAVLFVILMWGCQQVWNMYLPNEI